MKLFSRATETLRARRNNQKKQERQTNQSTNPSVSDFANMRTLKAALLGTNSNHSKTSNNNPGWKSPKGSTSSDSDEPSEWSLHQNTTVVEWKLPLVDTKASEPQSMEEELKRLQVLQSYFILDAESEVDFDRITQMASALFDAPIALISLVDLGRQWFLSRVGLDATETPRKHAFCAHVIVNKFNQLIVPDATKDVRFRDNPLVLGDPKIRFYAGAALVSPEGYKLGTLCIISPIAKPEGLTTSQQELLHNLAAMVVSMLVARRTRLERDEYKDRINTLANVLSEASHALGKTQRDLEANVLQEHRDSLWDNDDMDAPHMLVVSSAVKTLRLQSKMCAAATRTVIQEEQTYRQQQATLQKKVEESADFVITVKPKQEQDSGGIDDDDSWTKPSTATLMEDDEPTTDMKKLYTNINQVISTFPRDSCVVVTVESSVPQIIMAEDLLVFRCVLNLVTHCMGRSTTTAPTAKNGDTQLRIRARRGGTDLIIECQDGGKVTSSDLAKRLFANKDSLLAPIASMVRTMGGKYGMYLGRISKQEGPSKSVFWFSIPISDGIVQGSNNQKLVVPPASSSRIPKTLEHIHEPVSPTAVKSEDPFQKDVIGKMQCGGAVY